MLGKLWNTLNALSSKKPLKYALYLSAVIIFFAIILIPPILGILIKTPTIQNVINQPALMNTALTSIRNSFIVGLTVAALDVLAGVPLAWLITRSKSRWISILDTLADIPFVVPTAALGYSRRWNDLLFAHWPVPAPAIAALLPEGLQVDTFQGSAWLGIVPFWLDGLRVRGVPRIPALP